MLATMTATHAYMLVKDHILFYIWLFAQAMSLARLSGWGRHQETWLTVNCWVEKDLFQAGQNFHLQASPVFGYLLQIDTKELIVGPTPCLQSFTDTVTMAARSKREAGFWNTKCQILLLQIVYLSTIYITSRKARLRRASLLWHLHNDCCMVATPWQCGLWLRGYILWAHQVNWKLMYAQGNTMS